jgi:hypothetical protein
LFECSVSKIPPNLAFSTGGSLTQTLVELAPFRRYILATEVPVAKATARSTLDV